ncbi:MAG: hypothetical protein ACRYF5_06125 [Janthinobacterium lividum]
MIHQMLELIARRPQIRTVEIADLLDMEPDSVQPKLQKYIDGGQILLIPIIAPNGREANGFEFSESFKRTEIYASAVKNLPAIPPATLAQKQVTSLGKVEPKAAPSAPARAPQVKAAAPQSPVPTIKDTALPAAGTAALLDVPVDEPGVPVPEPAPTAPAHQLEYPATEPKAKGPTLDERVIKFVLQQPGRQASTAALKSFLGAKNYTAFMNHDTEGGELKRDGVYWTVRTQDDKPESDTRTAAPTTDAPAAQAAPLSISEISKRIDLAAARRNAARRRQTQRKAAAGEEDELSMALWSTGQLELMRGDRPLVTLKPAEIQSLLDYLQRVTAPVQA